MFERYTEPARRTLFYGRYEAAVAGSKAITPEFLFLGFLHEAQEILTAIAPAAPDHAQLRAAFVAQLPPRAEHLSTSADLPLSPDAKRVLAAAATAAAPSSPITPAHLLLGLYSMPHIAEFLELHQIPVASIREHLRQTNAPVPPPAKPPRAPDTVQKTRHYADFDPPVSVTESVTKTLGGLRYSVSVEVNGETREWSTDFDLTRPR